MPYDELERLEVYRSAERLADRVYELVQEWTYFDKDTVGKQLVRAADSIGANIAESYGRYYYGEQIRFLYFARGSLYEVKHWIRRAQARQLIQEETGRGALEFLDAFAVKLNAYIRSIRIKRGTNGHSVEQTSESAELYRTEDESALWEQQDRDADSNSRSFF